jgi:hypothetical protein
MKVATEKPFELGHYRIGGTSVASHSEYPHDKP